MQTTKELGEIFETFVSARKFDDKGREIGFIVGFRDNGEDFYAWVQNARRVGLNGEPSDFGTRQRSKKFASQQAANSWAYNTAREFLGVQYSPRILGRTIQPANVSQKSSNQTRPFGAIHQRNQRNAKTKY